MPWETTGTVSIAQYSNAVNGTGTSFITTGRVGDAFRRPDGAWYEVVNIASDSAVSIAPAYQGITVSGGNYALAPMQGYVKESADQLRAIVNGIGSKIADLEATGNDEVLPVAKEAQAGQTHEAFSLSWVSRRLPRFSAPKVFTWGGTAKQGMGGLQTLLAMREAEPAVSPGVVSMQIIQYPGRRWSMDTMAR